jgi:hypothetical protein
MSRRNRIAMLIQRNQGKRFSSPGYKEESLINDLIQNPTDNLAHDIYADWREEYKNDPGFRNYLTALRKGPVLYTGRGGRQFVSTDHIKDQYQQNKSVVDKLPHLQYHYRIDPARPEGLRNHLVEEYYHQIGKMSGEYREFLGLEKRPRSRRRRGLSRRRGPSRRRRQPRVDPARQNILNTAEAIWRQESGDGAQVINQRQLYDIVQRAIQRHAQQISESNSP